MAKRALESLLLMSCVASLSACGGAVALGGPQDAGTAEGGAPGAPAPLPITPPTGTLTRADKVDLLLMIDNSASMGDKQDLLKQAVPDLVGRLLNPFCVDTASGAIYGSSDGGACAQGKPEFAPVKDLHLGIVTSSLGGRGSDVCDGTDPAGAGAVRHDDDRAHLITRTHDASGEHVLPGTEAQDGVLAFGPGAITDSKRFLDDLAQVVGGIGEFGCGVEAQLESWYRFLVQPDPYNEIVPSAVDPQRREPSGVDATILRQRRAFLRPDSLVAVVVLTDEDEEATDPSWLGGLGWMYTNKRFPGSVGGAAPRGTSACDTNPTSSDCTSCAFPGHALDPDCQKPGDIDSTTGRPQLGYYTQRENSLNTRQVHMPQRYGVDPQFPIGRYVVGLSSANVPSRDDEHAPRDSTAPRDPKRDYIGDARCTNPLFAQDLPTDPGTDLCHLPAGPRSASLVVFAVITGVPDAMLHTTLDDAQWTRIVGRDPSSYDYSGVDPHMFQSMTPRPGLPPPSASDTADPENGREFDTQGLDLQLACTFTLPQPKDCTDRRFQGACDCNDSGPLPPLCDPANRHVQIRGKAYPAIRELSVARALGERGIVASICATHTTPSPSDPEYGYRPAIRELGDRMAKSLVLPQ
jgi:hypothetical protein